MNHANTAEQNRNWWTEISQLFTVTIFYFKRVTKAPSRSWWLAAVCWGNVYQQQLVFPPPVWNMYNRNMNSHSNNHREGMFSAVLTWFMAPLAASAPRHDLPPVVPLILPLLIYYIVYSWKYTGFLLSSVVSLHLIKTHLPAVLFHLCQSTCRVTVLYWCRFWSILKKS